MGLKTNITEMFGIKHPIVAAPMGPFYTKELAVAVSEAGGLGVLSHTNLFGKSSLEEMKSNMEYVVEHTDKPFGFNIRTSRLQLDAPGLCRGISRFIMNHPKIKEQCLYAVTSAGSPKTLPKAKTYQRLKESGSNINHFHVAPALWLADKCVTSGVDGMVITGWEGGGHQSYEKISTLVLLQQVVKKHPDIPLIACGGFASGEGLASALAMGAGAIAMGSRFIASKESEFHEKYKKPVLITENGTCTNDDEIRKSNLYNHLTFIKKACDEKIPVIGYFHWSTFDNYELYYGPSRRFGLTAVDLKSPKLERKIKESGHYYHKVVESNSIPEI